MKKILIDDNRLTPTMERVRSGRVQLFREYDKNNRTFISEENCDVKLEHEDKSMYAKLINWQWYWVCGCEECNGRLRDTVKSYIECEKHDVCIVCGISRKEIQGSVWGGIHGWTCKSCKEAEDLAIRKAAFEKLNGEEPDTYHKNKIICPHCGSELCDNDIHVSQELECYVCEGELYIDVEYSFHYTTSIIGNRIKD